MSQSTYLKLLIDNYMSRKSDPCLKAVASIQKGDDKTALTYLKNCKKRLRQNIRKLEKFPDKTDLLKIQLVRAYQLEGQIYFSRKSIGRAHSIFLEAIKVLMECALSQETKRLLASIEYSLALITFSENNWEKTREYLIASKSKYIELKEYHVSIDILSKLIEVLRQVGLNTDILECYREILKFSKKLDDKQLRMKVQAEALLGQGKVKHALQIKYDKDFDRALKIYRKLNDVAGEARILADLADFEQNDFDKALNILQKAMKLVENENIPVVIGLIQTKLGILFLKNGRFKEGQQHLLDGLDNRLQGGDKRGTAQTLLELSRITFLTARNKNDLKTAQDYAARSSALYEETEDKYGQAQSSELRASINTKLGMLDLAKKHAQDSRKLFKELGYNDAEGRMLVQLAIILDLQERRPEIPPILKRAERIFNQTKNQQGLAEVYQLYGIIAESKDDALRWLEMAKELYQQIADHEPRLEPIVTSIEKRIKSIEES
jgi:tetratricopeptide (TPR) repeat protein